MYKNLLMLRGKNMDFMSTLSSFDAVGLLEKVKDVLLIEKVITRLKAYWEMIPDGVFEFCERYKSYVLLAAVCLFVLLAFEGHKLFKMALYVAIPTGCGIAGFKFLAPFLSTYLADKIPEFADFNALVAIACALVGLFISRCAYNFVVMFLGGVCGYVFGYAYAWRVIRDFFSSLEFLKEDVARYIIAGVCAAVFVLLFILLFKHVVMAVSSFGCMAGAAILLQKLACPGANDMMKWCFVIVGCAVGVFAIVHQYKEEEKAYEILF